MLSKPLLPKGLTLAAAIVLAGNSLVAKAQDDIDTIVVVGATTNTVVSTEELEKFQAQDLEDVFRTVPSISVGGSIGLAQKIFIRGLEDTALNVTVDGAPQTSTLFHHTGRVAIEPELLKQVEVQAGAGEATSGFGAIGGAIRFETKEVDDLLGSTERFGGKLSTSYNDNDATRASVTAYGRLTDSIDLVASLVNSDSENAEDGDGNEIIGTGAERQLAFFKFGFDLPNDQKLSLSIENRSEQAEIATRPNFVQFAGWNDVYDWEADRTTLVANHEIPLTESTSLETTLYRTESSIAGGRYEYEGEIETSGFDLRATSELGNSNLTYGMEYRDDAVEAGSIDGSSYCCFDESGKVLGFYAQNHWQASDQLMISLGARFDDYEATKYGGAKFSDSGFSPNIGISYQINNQLTLTAGVAQALRALEIGDAFTIDAGDYQGTPTVDSDISAEKVTNSEIGLEYENSDGLTWSASVYKSTIDDVIQDKIAGDVFYENVGELETEGFELSMGYQWSDLAIQAGFSHNDISLNGNDVEGYEANGLGNARGDTLNLGLTYLLTDSLELGWNATYVQDLNDIEVFHRMVEVGWWDAADPLPLIDKPGYTTHDVYLSWTSPSDAVSVNLAVQNLLDETYRDHSSIADYQNQQNLLWEVIGQNEPGREIRLSVSYNF